LEVFDWLFFLYAAGFRALKHSPQLTALLGVDPRHVFRMCITHLALDAAILSKLDHD